MRATLQLLDNRNIDDQRSIHQMQRAYLLYGVLGDYSLISLQWRWMWCPLWWLKTTYYRYCCVIRYGSWGLHIWLIKWITLLYMNWSPAVDEEIKFWWKSICERKCFCRLHWFHSGKEAYPWKYEWQKLSRNSPEWPKWSIAHPFWSAYNSSHLPAARKQYLFRYL